MYFVVSGWTSCVCSKTHSPQHFLVVVLPWPPLWPLCQSKQRTCNVSQDKASLNTRGSKTDGTE